MLRSLLIERGAKRLSLAFSALLVMSALGLAIGVSPAQATGSYSLGPVNGPAGPGYGSASPASGTGAAQMTVTYAGTQVSTPQVINLTFENTGGHARFVQPATTQGSFSVPAGGDATEATCTTQANTGRCNFAVTASVSEPVVVRASPTSTADPVPTSSQVINFGGLTWTACANVTQKHDETTCKSQAATGTNTDFTVRVLENGGAVGGGGRKVNFTSSHPIFVAQQPPNTVLTNTSNNQASCDVASDGTCTVRINATSKDIEATLTATTVADNSGFPVSTARIGVRVMESVTPGRLVLRSQELVQPDVADKSTTPRPGEAVVQTLAVYACQPAGVGDTQEYNTCKESTWPLAGIPVSLSTDHGFFTPACDSSATDEAGKPKVANNYANCTFAAGKSEGTKVGNLTNLGQAITATTATNGTIKATVGIGRDQGFDDDGLVASLVSASAGGVTLPASVAGQSATSSSFTCNAPASANVQAGCPKGIGWSSLGAPLNGGTPTVVSIKPKLTNEKPLVVGQVNYAAFPLQRTDDNESFIFGSAARVYAVQLPDQFGNLTRTSGARLVASGAGSIIQCAPYPVGDDVDVCGDPGAAPATTTDPATQVKSYTFSNVRGSLETAAGTSTGQTRFKSEAAAYNSEADQPAGDTQTLSLTWESPVTTFKSATSTNGVWAATYETKPLSPASQQGLSINFYVPFAQDTGFTVTPGTTVAPGTVVSISGTITDQHGSPIANDLVEFTRSGPNPNNALCTATTLTVQTNSSGKAGFSFACTADTVQPVTILVKDWSGNELYRKNLVITFKSDSPPPTTGPKKISPTMSVKRAGAGKAKVTVSVPGDAGAKVTVTVKPAKGKATTVSGKLSSAGTFTTTVKKLKKKTKVTFTAVVSANGAYASGKSKPVVYTVK